MDTYSGFFCIVVIMILIHQTCWTFCVEFAWIIYLSIKTNMRARTPRACTGLHPPFRKLWLLWYIAFTNQIHILPIRCFIQAMTVTNIAEKIVCKVNLYGKLHVNSQCEFLKYYKEKLSIQNWTFLDNQNESTFEIDISINLYTDIYKCLFWGVKVIIPLHSRFVWINIYFDLLLIDYS